MTAHELGHDVRVVLQLVEMLVDVQADGDLEAATTIGRRVRDAVVRLGQDLDELLVAGGGDLTRLQRRPTNLGQLVGRVVRAHPVDDRAIDLTAHDVVLNVDRVKVERIVDNLLANALEHTPSGTPVRVGVSLVPGGAEIVVEDDGRGIPAEVRRALAATDAATQGDTATPTGLRLAAFLAQVHGGQMTVADGHGGHGARVTVRLPARDT